MRKVRPHSVSLLHIPEILRIKDPGLAIGVLE